MNENVNENGLQAVRGHEGEQKEDGTRSQLSRRKLLASLGMASAAAVLYGTNPHSAVNGESVTDAVYRRKKAPEASCCTTVSSVSELRTLPGGSDGKLVELIGYYNDTPGYGGGMLHWNAASSAPDDGGTVFAVSGITTGRWERSSPHDLTVYHWGARNGTESSHAIQSAFDYVRNSGLPGAVDFGDNGFFLINKPIRGTYSCMMKGSAMILAQAPFEEVTFAIHNGGQLSVSPMFYFVDGISIGNYKGSRRFGLTIAKELILNCDDVAGVGLFLDNYFDYNIYCRIKDPLKWGVWHYSNGWAGELHPYITGPGEGGIWLGGACNGINLDHAKIWGETKTPSVAGLLIDGDNNGLSCNGTVIEKAARGVICRNGSGPVNLTGIDFELIENEVVWVDGTTTSSRICGPVTVSSDFLETTSPTAALVKAENAIVIVTGCRMRRASRAFEVIGAGYIMEEGNVIEASVASIGSNRVLRRGLSSGRTYFDNNYAQATNALINMREMNNYSYPYAPAALSSGLHFAHFVTHAASQRMVGSSTWFVTDMNGGEEADRMGLSLSYTGGGVNKRIIPLEDNATALGFASNRFSVIYAGTGTISTSDRNEKQDIRPIGDDVFLAWEKVQFCQFRFKNAVAQKGEGARTHIGLIAQEVKEAFESSGLDAFQYGLLCYDEWTEEEDGREDKAAGANRSSSRRLGIRYEEALALECAYLRWKLTRDK